MNKTREEAKSLIDNLKNLVKDISCKIIICVPFTNLQTAIECCLNSNIKVAAQNCHFEDCGAFTGEISPIMLKELGVEYVILGHSERREYFAETDKTINKKLESVLGHGLKPILCIGETLDQRELGITEEVISTQLKITLNNLTQENIKDIIIAYEPVWAIGTGKNATCEQANDVCKHIRKVIKDLYSEDISESLTIQYGGSMNASNATDLLAQSDIDGGLIGGASLKVSDFSIIINATNL